MIAKRGLSSDDARKVRQQGHDDALEFAVLIGMESDYRNNQKAKKDVIDPSGDAHSLKSGHVKWQIFLYGMGRFRNDEQFAVMNGMGQFLIDCIDAFPIKFSEYTQNKAEAKEKCRIPMRNLAEKLQAPARVRGFLHKSMFNGGEVDYLTIKHQGNFHVFAQKDVLDAMQQNFTVENSQARSVGQFPEQKVIFKYNGTNIGEIEMRNDSEVHYREIRFNMMKPRFMRLLFSNFHDPIEMMPQVLVYGEAKKKFGRWKR